MAQRSRNEIIIFGFFLFLFSGCQVGQANMVKGVDKAMPDQAATTTALSANNLIETAIPNPTAVEPTSTMTPIPSLTHTATTEPTPTPTEEYINPDLDAEHQQWLREWREGGFYPWLKVSYVNKEVADFDGWKIPYDLAIDYKISNRIDMPISQVDYLDQSVINIIVDYFLENSRLRYNDQYPENQAVNLSSYKEMVRNGGGKYSIPGVDEATAKGVREVTDLDIDPALGVIIILDEYPSLAMTGTGNKTFRAYVGKSPDDRLVISVNTLSSFMLIGNVRDAASNESEYMGGLRIWSSFAGTFDALDIIKCANDQALRAKAGNYFKKRTYTCSRDKDYQRALHREKVVPLFFGPDSGANVVFIKQ